MRRDSPFLAYALATVASTALWVATAALSGRREPWDWSGYWTVSYPMAIAMAGVLGYLFPERPWRWALAVMFTQAAVMVAGGSGLGLLPLGLALLAVLALPAIGLAQLAGRLRRRRDSR